MVCSSLLAPGTGTGGQQPAIKPASNAGLLLGLMLAGIIGLTLFGNRR